MEDNITPGVETPELPKITLKMSAEEILNQVKTYLATADSSLAKVDESIEKTSAQLNSLHQMKLMITGQKALVTDLYGKMVEAPKESAANG